MFKLPEDDWDSVIDPITEEQAKKWIANLRSGEYAQGRLRLKTDTSAECSYCCLGVLAEQEGKLKTSGGKGYFGGNSTALSVGGPDYCDVYLTSDMQNKCISWNDEDGLTFVEIADKLEEAFGLKDA